MLLVVCGGAVACVAVVGNAVNDVANSLPSVAATNNQPGTNPTNGNNPTSGNNPAGKSFNLAPGTTATITEGANKWTVTVSNPVWHDGPCNSFGEVDGRLIVVNVTFEVVAGEASINPLYFEYIDSDGASGELGLFAGCDEPSLDSGNDFPAGTKRTGKISFDVLSGKAGAIEYTDGFGSLTASWKIAA